MDGSQMWRKMQWRPGCDGLWWWGKIGVAPTVCCSCNHQREGDGNSEGRGGKSRVVRDARFLRVFGEDELMDCFMLVFTWKDQQ